MARARKEMTPPAVSPSPYGLLTVASELPGPEKWSFNGTSWRETCPEGARTYDECTVLEEGDSPPTTGLPKTQIEAVHLRAATVFWLYAQFDCPAVGFSDDGVRDLAERTLNRVTPFQVEQAFATGQAAGDQVVHPHLQSSLVVAEDIYSGDGRVVLSQAAENLTAATVDPVEAMGLLEGALAECYKGLGVIHVPTTLLASLVAFRQVTLRNGRYVSPAGHLVAVGDGYPGDAPDGTTPTDALYMYATGQVWYHRGEVQSFPLEQTLDRDNNSVDAIAERPYLIGYECCLFAAEVTTGGVESGSADSAAI